MAEEISIEKTSIETVEIKTDGERTRALKSAREEKETISKEEGEREIEEDSAGNKEIKSSEEIKMDDFIEERKKKVLEFLKKSQIWVLGFLIIAVILGVYIRSMPMQDRGGKPGLWDITKNTWTLGPDLDPWLFFRYAKSVVEQGSISKIDMMRYVPLGFDTSVETPLLPYMIAWTYYFIKIFSDVDIEFAAVIFPVIMFALTIVAFFLFVREIFIRKSKESIIKANIIALISTFFMIVTPVFLSRSVAGIPEKESAAFFFMFLAFYFFLRAWKSEKIKNTLIWSILSGIFTAMMGLVWGGVLYILITVSAASLIAFVLDKINKKEFIIYSMWFFFSSLLLMLFSSKYKLVTMATSLSSGPPFVIFFIFLVHFLLWGTKISQINFLQRIKLPKSLISLIISVLLLTILISIFLGPSFIIIKIKAIHETIFNPVTGRWNITVAENRQPFFTEWSQSFGPFIKGIPILFWLFFIGSVLLFRKALDKIENKDAWILTGLYVLFFFGLVFSRYAPHPHIMDGEGFISKLFYYGSAFLLFGFLVYYHYKYSKEENDSFKKIDYEFIFLFSVFMLTLFTARGAVRLIMVLAPIAPIFLGFLIMESIDSFRKTKDETWKVTLALIIILILISSVFTFWAFYKSIKGQAHGFIPSSYNLQWQKAMSWVREKTPKYAVFGHWWDYGYWVQSIGERATILDGGNAITYWNYLMGRLVLTGDNQEDALEYLYNHNATHLLIDSSDIGKYGAFSSIGSDKDYDRYSWMGTFLLDEKQTQETKNQTLLFYSGGVALDEDLIVNEGGEILLPKQKAGVGAIILPIEKTENGSRFLQPYVIIVYQSRQHQVNLKYLYANGEFIEFKDGIEAVAYFFPRLIQDGQRISQNILGAAIYLSPRLTRGYLSQKYILDDPFNKFPNFKLVHTEPDLMIDSLRSQGMNLPDFVFFQGVQGPIKIWEIEYTGDEKVKEEYLDRDYSKYIDWKL